VVTRSARAWNLTGTGGRERRDGWQRSLGGPSGPGGSARLDAGGLGMAVDAENSIPRATRAPCLGAVVAAGATAAAAAGIDLLGMGLASRRTSRSAARAEFVGSCGDLASDLAMFAQLWYSPASTYLGEVS